MGALSDTLSINKEYRGEKGIHKRSSIMKIASINGIDMAYRDEGAGQPILFIHAFPLHSALWERQIAAFSPHHRVIAPDLRGLGATARGSGAASLDQHADDLAGLLGHLEIEH